MVTIATNETDGYKRFMRSARMFNIDVEVASGVGVSCACCEGVMCAGGGDERGMERRRCSAFPWWRS